MEATDLDILDYSDASAPFFHAYRGAGTCRRRIYLQQHVSGNVYPVILTCGSNACPECGPNFRRRVIGWLALCFAPHERLFIAWLPGESWEAAKRRLQRHSLDYVWVKNNRGTRFVVASGDFGARGSRCVEVSPRTALLIVLTKLRHADRLGPRAVDASRGWRESRHKPREEPRARKLATARIEVTESELLDIARELHLDRGGRWPAGAPRPPDLTPNDFGDLFAEAIDEDWRRWHEKGRRNRKRRT